MKMRKKRFPKSRNDFSEQFKKFPTWSTPSHNELYMKEQKNMAVKPSVALEASFKKAKQKRMLKKGYKKLELKKPWKSVAIPSPNKNPLRRFKMMNGMTGKAKKREKPSKKSVQKSQLNINQDLSNLADTQIKQYSNFLLKKIPVMENYSELIYINLSHNQITSMQMDWVKKDSKFERLKILDLSHNKISTIPMNLLTNTPILENLDISFNLVSEVPMGLVLLKNLKILNLGGNYFKRLPTFLRHIRLRKCYHEWADYAAIIKQSLKLNKEVPEPSDGKKKKKCKTIDLKGFRGLAGSPKKLKSKHFIDFFEYFEFTNQGLKVEKTKLKSLCRTGVARRHAGFVLSIVAISPKMIAEKKLGTSNLIELAMVSGQEKLVLSLLTRYKNREDISEWLSSSGCGFFALKHRFLKIKFFEILLEKRQNINKVDHHRRTLLHHTFAKFDNYAQFYEGLASRLLAKGAFANVEDRSGYTPLAYAVINKQMQAIQLANRWNQSILNATPPPKDQIRRSQPSRKSQTFDFNHQNPQGSTILHLACRVSAMSVIAEIGSHPEISPLVTDSNFRLASSRVNQDFTNSRKLALKLERKKLRAMYFREGIPEADTFVPERLIADEFEPPSEEFRFTRLKTHRPFGASALNGGAVFRSQVKMKNKKLDESSRFFDESVPDQKHEKLKKAISIRSIPHSNCSIPKHPNIKRVKIGPKKYKNVKIDVSGHTSHIDEGVTAGRMPQSIAMAIEKQISRLDGASTVRDSRAMEEYFQPVVRPTTGYLGRFRGNSAHSLAKTMIVRPGGRYSPAPASLASPTGFERARLQSVSELLSEKIEVLFEELDALSDEILRHETKIDASKDNSYIEPTFRTPTKNTKITDSPSKWGSSQMFDDIEKDMESTKNIKMPKRGNNTLNILLRQSVRKYWILSYQLLKAARLDQSLRNSATSRVTRGSKEQNTQLEIFVTLGKIAKMVSSVFQKNQIIEQKGKGSLALQASSFGMEMVKGQGLKMVYTEVSSGGIIRTTVKLFSLFAKELTKMEGVKQQVGTKLDNISKALFFDFQDLSAEKKEGDLWARGSYKMPGLRKAVTGILGGQSKKKKKKDREAENADRKNQVIRKDYIDSILCIIQVQQDNINKLSRRERKRLKLVSNAKDKLLEKEDLMEKLAQRLRRKNSRHKLDLLSNEVAKGAKKSVQADEDGMRGRGDSVDSLRFMDVLSIFSDKREITPLKKRSKDSILDSERRRSSASNLFIENDDHEAVQLDLDVVLNSRNTKYRFKSDHAPLAYGKALDSRMSAGLQCYQSRYGEQGRGSSWFSSPKKRNERVSYNTRNVRSNLNFL